MIYVTEIVYGGCKNECVHCPQRSLKPLQLICNVYGSGTSGRGLNKSVIFKTWKWKWSEYTAKYGDPYSEFVLCNTFE